MPAVPARLIALTASERERLKKMAYGHKTEYRLRARAQLVPHAVRGRSDARIAPETGLHLDTVRRWRGRFVEQRLAVLADRRRSGCPPAFTALQMAEVKAPACRLPAETGTPPITGNHPGSASPHDQPRKGFRSRLLRARAGGPVRSGACL
ncbi:helix-turn-helix domain-containing protein [Actinacidiphila glaucinigra]|uniref:helix-turn-helix domain-containing protein n=1 Tax=Actinacidiphila glaucinigra TaxID=235986 RepID=UPI002DDA100B|nr:helix-turn-helix domain-containing protein [Actinacidiphila glaucinigra]WSD57881.1 helix-turn-helix domain-containing protein [Actinacidiphila glaucinigra]